MSKTGKVLTVVGVCLVILIIAVVVAGKFALDYVEKRLDVQSKPAIEAGTAIGKTTDQNGCVTAGLSRGERVALTDFSGGIALASFMDACFKEAKPSDGFCKGVPSFWDPKDSEWMVAQCALVGMDPRKTGCGHVFQSKHRFCNP